VSVADWTDSAALERFAQSMTPEEVQLDYEIVTRGRSELGLAPDEYAGFTMTLMRLLAFRPGEPAPVPEPEAASRGRAATAALAASSAGGARAAALATVPEPRGPGRDRDAPPPGRAKDTPLPAAGSPERMGESSASDVGLPSSGAVFDGDWMALTRRIKVSGLARQLVEQAELAHFADNTFHLRVPIKSLLETTVLEKLRVALMGQFGASVKVTAELGAVQGQTVAAAARSERAERQAQAVASIEADPFVRALVKDFGATIVPGSIKPAP
jgi:DNA polymerase-3 subunit gamma/tau